MNPLNERPWGAGCDRAGCHWTTRDEGYATRGEAMNAMHKHLTAEHRHETARQTAHQEGTR